MSRESNRYNTRSTRRDPDPDSSDSDSSSTMSGPPAAPAAPAALAPSFTADQFQQLMAGFANNATRQAKTFTAPRVGGTNSTGVWTGMGSDGAGTAPKSANCYRAFDADVIKNHTAMAPIEVKCQAGLKDSPELRRY